MNRIFKKINSLKSNTLIRGSAILFSATMIVNFGTYLFQLILGNLLGTTEYGNFVALASLTYVITLPATALQVFSAKNISDLASRNEKDRMKYFIIHLSKIVFLITIAIGILMIFLIPSLKEFLRIESSSSYLIILAYLLFMTEKSILFGVLLGLEKYKKLAIAYVIEILFRLFIGTLLVTQGFKTPGALAGLVAGSIVSLLYALFSIKEIIKEKIEEIKISFDIKEFFTILLVSSAINIFLIADVILAKHYLTDHESGIYASTSILGRVIFFLSASIGNAIIPATVKAKNKGSNYESNFVSVLMVATLAVASVLLLYVFFPEFMVRLLYGDSFKETAKYIGKFGLAMVMLSFINIFHSYLIAINKRGHVVVATIAIVAQIFLISQYHSSIGEIVNVQLGVLSVTAGLIFGYWIFASKIQKDQKIRSTQSFC
ncbi:oligosaccharide flippase family protein [Candidatus Dojkabacteria bacterium]|nr:oligosaccharide flippase family protein [Candidatus Dojkabacteria bacterium]